MLAKDCAASPLSVPSLERKKSRFLWPPVRQARRRQPGGAVDAQCRGDTSG